MRKIIDEYFHLVILSILIILIGYWYLSSLNGLKNLSKRQKFTIAKAISDWHHKNTNGIGVDYEYFVSNRQYSNTINMDLKKGQKYLLVFDSIKPENNVILDIYPINNQSIAPEKGWKLSDVPISIDSTTINDLILNN